MLNSRLNCIKKLLDAGADVNEPTVIEKDVQQKTALIRAVEK